MSNQQDPNLQSQNDFNAPAAPSEPTAPSAPAAPSAPLPPAYTAPAAPQHQAAPAPGYTQAPGYTAAPGYAQAPAAAPTNTMAIVSMISSIIGWFAFGSLCIVGVILGHISLKQIKTSGEGGRGMALTGVIMGYIGIAGWVIGLIIFFVVLGIAGASIAAAGASAGY